MSKKLDKKLPEVNIGLVGHVDHGKTTLTQQLTGKWADTHSEEKKRGITIRLGYADASFYYCSKCDMYSNTSKCKKGFEDGELKRTVSFIDAPGHETLMATVLSSTALMDGAVLLIAADEECPQPQTAEHLKALDVAGIENIVVVQNKIDLVSEKDAKKNYEQIKKFLKNTVAENAPIIPTSAETGVNISEVIRSIEKEIKTPQRNEKEAPRFLVARSFDVNKPGTEIEKLKGGVIGGSVIGGILKKGDKIEIKPGSKQDEKWVSLTTKVMGIIQSGQKLEEASPGGLIAIQTGLDPFLTKSDALAGSLVGLEGQLPESKKEVKLDIELFDHVIGVEGKVSIDEIKTNDILMLTFGVAKTVGFVKAAYDNVVEAELKIPVACEAGEKVAVSKQVGRRWHLIGIGKVIED